MAEGGPSRVGARVPGGRVVCVLGLALVLGAAGRPAAAQPASGDAGATPAGASEGAGDATPGASEDRREAEFQRTIEEALAAYGGGNWADARALFVGAHRIRPSANAVRLGAVCSYELREYPVAFRGFEQALAMREAPLSAQQRREAEDGLERTARFLGVLELQLAPSSATATIDGVLAEPDGQGRVLLTPGSHELRVEAPGFQPFAQRLSILGGERERVEVTLEEVAVAPVPVPGTGTGAPAPPVAPALSDAERRALAQHEAQRAQAEERRLELDREAFEANARNRRRLKWGRFFVAAGTVTTLGAIGLRFWADYDENQDRAVAAGCFGCGEGDPGLQDDLRRAAGPLLGTGVTFTVLGAVLTFVGKRRRRVVDANAGDEDAPRASTARARRTVGCGPLGAGLRCAVSF